jgi:hypothetical protein
VTHRVTVSDGDLATLAAALRVYLGVLTAGAGARGSVRHVERLIKRLERLGVREG